MSSNSSSHSSSALPRRVSEVDPSADLDDVDDMRSVMVEDQHKSSIWVPLSLFGSAVALGAFIVLKGRGDGRGLGQRIMEARVAAQATTVAGLVLAGIYSYQKTKPQRQTDSERRQRS